MNNNGHLTFTEPLSAFVPYLNAGIDIIAPLWTDLFNVNGGTISYREDTSSAVLAQVTQAVNQYFPNVPFTATSAFVATWDSVPYITGGGVRPHLFFLMNALFLFSVLNVVNRLLLLLFCFVLFFEGGYFPSGFSLQW